MQNRLICDRRSLIPTFALNYYRYGQMCESWQKDLYLLINPCTQKIIQKNDLFNSYLKKCNRPVYQLCVTFFETSYLDIIEQVVPSCWSKFLDYIILVSSIISENTLSIGFPKYTVPGSASSWQYFGSSLLSKNRTLIFTHQGCAKTTRWRLWRQQPDMESWETSAKR